MDFLLPNGFVAVARYTTSVGVRVGVVNELEQLDLEKHDRV